MTLSSDYIAPVSGVWLDSDEPESWTTITLRSMFYGEVDDELAEMYRTNLIQELGSAEAAEQLIFDCLIQPLFEIDPLGSATEQTVVLGQNDYFTRDDIRGVIDSLYRDLEPRFAPFYDSVKRYLFSFILMSLMFDDIIESLGKILTDEREFNIPLLCSYLMEVVPPENAVLAMDNDVDIRLAMEVSNG